MSDPFAPPPSANQQRRGGSDRGRRRSGGPMRDTPQWPLTCVGAHPLSSGNTVTGDMSQEELRAQAYAAAPRGMSQEIAQREETMVKEYQLRNNGETTSQSQTPMPTDPFGGQAQSLQANSQSLSQQQPFSQPLYTSQPAQPPIFQSVAPASGLAGFAQPSGNGFSTTVSQQQAPSISMMPLGTVQPGVPTASQNAPASLQPTESRVEPYAQAQFAFQKVPETAPPPTFQ